MPALVVLTTAANADEARSLADKIVEAGVAGCVQILPQMTSVYVWEGAVRHENEHLLLIKTLSEKWEALHDLIASNHSYSVPEIVAVNAEKVSEAYLEWLTDTVRSKA